MAGHETIGGALEAVKQYLGLDANGVRIVDAAMGELGMAAPQPPQLPQPQPSLRAKVSRIW